MRKGQSQRALGRLASLVIAGAVACAVVAAIAIAASNGSKASLAGPKDSAPFGVVKLGSLPEFSMIAYSWGVSNSGTTHVGGGAGAGKANVQDLSFTKYTDANTVELLNHVTTGQHFPTAVITVTDPATSATLVYEMQEVLVTSDSLGGSVQNGGKPVSPTENVSLNFAKVKWTYTDAAGNSTSGSWDIAATTT